jgi:hypothetical protein
MVGGAPVTQEFADDMGADGYGKDALACIATAKRLLGIGVAVPAWHVMQRIDPEEYQKRLDRITEMLMQIAVHADELSRMRCPYKNRLGRCTAQFGCRNKRKPPVTGELPVCSGDDKLDYRGAWET